MNAIAEKGNQTGMIIWEGGYAEPDVPRPKPQPRTKPRAPRTSGLLCVCPECGRAVPMTIKGLVRAHGWRYANPRTAPCPGSRTKANPDRVIKRGAPEDR